MPRRLLVPIQAPVFILGIVAIVALAVLVHPAFVGSEAEKDNKAGFTSDDG